MKHRERILVVDDDRDIVRLVSAYLAQAGFEPLAAFDGEAAMHAIRRERPDLVVLDIMLPGHDGWDITRRVRADAALGGMPIILLTARVGDTDRILGLELGADDYVTKPFNPREVVARVRAVLRRSAPGGLSAPPRVARVRDLVVDPARHTATRGGVPLDLTPTEFSLLQTLVENAGWVFTRSELIERALGYVYEGMDRTLDSHIKNLRRKIEPDPKAPTYIQTVYGIGYRLAGGPADADDRGPGGATDPDTPAADAPPAAAP